MESDEIRRTVFVQYQCAALSALIQHMPDGEVPHEMRFRLANESEDIAKAMLRALDRNFPTEISQKS